MARIVAALRVSMLLVCPAAAPESTAYSRPRPVTLVGYDDDAMEPFLTRDGRVLLFNNSNDPAAQTDLHWAERIDDTTFAWRGQLQGVNTDALEGVPSTDNQSQLYFVSPREYASTRATVYRGRLHDGRVESLQRLDSLASNGQAMVVFDAEVSADGQWLALSEGRFGGAPSIWIAPRDYRPAIRTAPAPVAARWLRGGAGTVTRRAAAVLPPARWPTLADLRGRALNGRRPCRIVRPGTHHCIPKLLSDKDQTYVACTKTFARNWATEFHLAGQGL